MITFLSKEKRDRGRWIVLQYTIGDIAVHIDRLVITTHDPLLPPVWCEIAINDRMTHAGPYQWFATGGMHLWVAGFMNMTVRVMVGTLADRIVQEEDVRHVEFFHQDQQRYQVTGEI